MSAAVGPAARGRAPSDLLVLGLVALIVAGLVYWAARDGERPLWHSPIGFDGLVAWLQAGGLDARSFHGGALLERERLGLRVLPLYDGNIDHWRETPQSREELIRQADQVDILRAIVYAKIRHLPTLVVLPKWRTGVALTGVVHPDLLRDAADNPVDRGQLLPGRSAKVEVQDGGFRDFPVRTGPAAGLRVRLYMPQMVRGSFCEPVIGGPDAMLLGRCLTNGRAYWLLADPDLLSNHGLRLGDNAEIARRQLAAIADGKPVVVDYSTFVWSLGENTGPPARDGRTWSDLGRFFVPPFAWLWIGFAALAAMVLWRAAVRYGPVQRGFEDGPRAAKEVGIAAKARLLRLSGRDDQLLRAHVAGRLQALAAELLGPHRQGEPLETLGRLVGRRDPALGRELREAALGAETLPPDAAGTEVVRRLDRFEIAMEQVLNDFGRSSRPR